MTFRYISDISSTKRDSRKFIPSSFFPLSNTKIGIEVEMEQPNDNAVSEIVRSGLWSSKIDNSLRNGVELVTSPIFGEDIISAVEILESVFSRKRPVFNERCSVHIHMEVVDLQKEELQKLLMLYTALERTLFNFVGENRANNVYCLPYYKSSVFKELLYNVFHVLKEDDLNYARHTVQSWPKYSALNLRRISDIGTIEFRHMHGTIDSTKLLTWIRLLMSLKKFALEMQAVDDFPEFVSGFVIEDYFCNVFGKDLAEQVFTMNSHQETLLGVRYVQDVLLRKQIQDLRNQLQKKYRNKQGSYFSMYGAKKKISEEEYKAEYISFENPTQTANELNTFLATWRTAPAPERTPGEVTINNIAARQAELLRQLREQQRQRPDPVPPPRPRRRQRNP